VRQIEDRRRPSPSGAKSERADSWNSYVWLRSHTTAQGKPVKR
jgi:hypothetical protein